jgi:hypothetical protein
MALSAIHDERRTGHGGMRPRELSRRGLMQEDIAHNAEDDKTSDDQGEEPPRH